LSAAHAGPTAAGAPGDRLWSLDATPPADYEPPHPIDYANASLTEIADHFKTDKGSIKHRYTEVYERYLAPLRRRAGVALLEIGVACGASLKMWSKYFSDARVVGVDVRDGCAGLCRNYPGISIRIADARALRQPESFDVVIDDGSHISADIVDIYRTNWPSLVPGGVYFIEDLKCTHNPLYPKQTAMRAAPERFERRHFVEFINRLLVEMDWGRGEVESLHFLRELAMIRKAGR
jgi:cyclopropane fatty-acyl-phospholipid synthase-like methyltransferase